jgi:pilus assembly protein CpaB
MKTQTLVIAALALVFSLSTAAGVHLYLKNRSGSDDDTASVVVAATEIPRDVTLTPNHLTVKQWPKSLIPAGAVTRVEDAQGSATLHPFVKGEVLLASKLSAKASGRGLAALIPPGMRAYTIHTPQIASGVAGFVLPGNKVDVLFTVSTPEGTTGGATTVTLLQNVEILAVDQHLTPPTENRVDYRMLQSVTLLVTPAQAAKLDLAQNRGTLHLMLRNPEDVSTASTTPTTLSELELGPQKVKESQAPKLPSFFQKMLEPKPAGPTGPVVKPQPLEIRTLRGVYEGVVPVEQVRPAPKS